MYQCYGVLVYLEGIDKGFVVIGYGKLGGYELGYGLDLDLVFLYNVFCGISIDGKKFIEV